MIINLRAGRRAQLLLVTLLVIAMISLSGCAALPQSGPVRDSQARLAEDSPLVQQALGPVPGSSPVKLVQDFLRACAAGTYDDFQVAKQYLTKQAAASWKPTEEIHVAVSGSTPQVVGEDSQKAKNPVEISISTKTLGIIDKVGIFDQKPDGSYAQTLKLVKDESDQWRISRLSNGIVIPNTSFNTAYTRRNVYFISADGAYLVADPRYYPRRRLAQSLILGLLAGPSVNLSSAVTTAFASGTTLSQDSIDIQSGIATVDLSSNVADASERVQSLMLAQVEATLKGVPGIDSVSLSANGAPLVVKNAFKAKNLELSRMVGFDKRGLVHFNGPNESVLITASTVDSLNLSMPAVSPDPEGPLAVVSNRDSLMMMSRDRQYLRLIARGTKLSAPSVDRSGWVWAVQDQPDNFLLIVNAEEQTAKVPLAISSKPQQVAVNQNGAVVAILATTPSGYTLELGAIKRDANGKPTGVELFRVIELGKNPYRQVQWIDDTSLAVLATGTAPLVKWIELQGIIQELEAPASTEGLLCGGDSGSLGIYNSDLLRFRRIGPVWRENGVGVRSPRFAG